jgi:hypothetical protein
VQSGGYGAAVNGKERWRRMDSGTKTIKNRYNYGNEKNLPAFSS